MTDADEIRGHLLRLGVTVCRVLTQHAQRGDALVVEAALIHIDHADDTTLLHHAVQLFTPFQKVPRRGCGDADRPTTPKGTDPND